MNRRMRRTANAALRRAQKKWAPPERISTKDWANRYRRLSPLEAARPGRYDTDVVPYLAWENGPLDALDDPRVEVVACQKSAQVAWTSGVLGNGIARKIDVDPGPMLVLFPKDGSAKEYMAEKFEPMVEATPRLRARVDTRSRKLQQRQTFKRFPGGFLKLVGSNSPASVKSSPIPWVAVEEPDDCNLNLKGQGDSIQLAKERMKSFYRRKAIIGGSPTIEGLSAIANEMEKSDKRIGLVACHGCGEEHQLSFDNLHCNEDPNYHHPIFGRFRPETAFYSCPHCGEVWDDAQKNDNVLHRGRWQATAEFHGTAGFYLNELYSSFPGSTFAILKEKQLTAQHYADTGDISKLISFTNSQMGQTWAYKSDAPEIEVLEKRCEQYLPKVVPPGGLLITMGVDVQHDRLAVVIRAWGRGEESWLLWWGELHGNPGDKNDPVWSELDSLFYAAYPHASGARLGIAAMSIDSSDGTTSDAVYSYVRTRQKHGVMAIKGASLDNREREIFSKPRQSVDSNKRHTKAEKYGLRPYLVGTHKAKSLIDGRLKLEGAGPGRMHWYEGVGQGYFEQLTNEVLAPHPRNPTIKVWQKKAGRRNEALDCEVYSLHAARAKRTHLMKDSEWQDLEHRLIQNDLFREEPVETITDAQPTEQQPTQGGGWLSTHANWIKGN
ncbi:Terminase GpA [Pseudomonas sp. 8Z]|nr:Terminase GpA [Pseudomonas sp. 8Z]